MSFVIKTFNETDRAMTNILNMASANTQEPKQLLELFYAELSPMALNSDILPVTAAVYKQILSKLPYAEVTKSLEYMLNFYTDVVVYNPMLITDMIPKNPQFAGWVFDKLCDKIQSAGKKSLRKFFNVIIGLVEKVPQQEAIDFVNHVLRFPRAVLKLAVRKLVHLAVQVPDTRRDVVMAMIEYSDRDSDKGLDELYSDLISVLVVDDSLANICMDVIEQDLQRDNLTSKSAEAMLRLMLRIPEGPKYNARAMKVLDKIKSKKSVMTINNLRIAARKLGDVQELRSTLRLGKRVQKTDDNIYGWINVREIPVDEACVLVLGGSGTENDDEAANGYASFVEDLLNQNNIGRGVGIYSIIYSFGDTDQDKNFAFDDKVARKILMSKYGRRTKKAVRSESVDDYNPRYVRELFESIFLPRISSGGKKINSADAMRNLRNINIVAHCHGAYTFLKLEEMMQQKMVDLGYTKQEREIIQKQLLCVAYAPDCPLGVSKSTLISFVSGADTKISSYNHFEYWARRIKDANIVAWFPGKRGNVFLTPRVLTDFEYADEHSFHGYVLDDEHFSKSGKVSTTFEGNAIVNGVKSSIKHSDIPDVKELVTGGDKSLEELFDKAEENGKYIYEKMLENIKLSMLKRQDKE